MPFPIQRAQNSWRYDPVDEAWTLVARNRRFLPGLEVALPKSERVLREHAVCPFCTTKRPDPVIDAVDGKVGTTVAIPSPTPLTFVEHGPPPAAPWIDDGALGAHELLVPVGPAAHAERLTDLGAEWLEDVFVLFGRRHKDLARDVRLLSLQLAILPPGAARFEHLHASLLALPLPPLEALPPETCPVHADFENARRSGRLVFEDHGLYAYVPFAPRTNVHVRLVTGLAGSAERMPPSEKTQRRYARRIHGLVTAIEEVLPSARCAVSLKRVPFRPHLGRVAPLLADVEVLFDPDEPLGRANGMRVVSLSPEELAETLRKATS